MLMFMTNYKGKSKRLSVIVFFLNYICPSKVNHVSVVHLKSKKLSQKCFDFAQDTFMCLVASVCILSILFLCMQFWQTGLRTVFLKYSETVECLLHVTVST